MGWLRRVRSSELNFGQFHHTLDRPAHYAPRDGISGGPRGTVSQRPCGVMPAWPFGFFYCLTVKIRTLGERPLLAPSGHSLDQRCRLSAKKATSPYDSTSGVTISSPSAPSPQRESITVFGRRA